MSSCLVTGAGGFIGGHLVESLLARGHHVSCLMRPTSSVSRLKDLPVQLHYDDLLAPRNLAQTAGNVDVVYHVAGVTHTLCPAEQTKVNRDGVTHMLEACARRTTPPVFVLVSSVAAAGPVERGRLRSEADPPTPVSQYGISKLAGEQAAYAFADRVPITIVRPGIVFGPRDRNMLPLFRMVSKYHVHLTLGRQTPALSLLHVADLLDLLMRVATKGKRLPTAAALDGVVAQGCYFGCAPEHPTYRELGTLIANAVANEHICVLPLPMTIAWLVAAANEALGRVMGRSSFVRVDKVREAKAASWACTGAAAECDLGFAPACTLPERLDETAQWYFERGWMRTPVRPLFH